MEQPRAHAQGKFGDLNAAGLRNEKMAQLMDKYQNAEGKNR